MRPAASLSSPSAAGMLRNRPPRGINEPVNERFRKAIDDGASAVEDARTAVSDAASDAAAAVGEVATKVKPRLRGVSHFWAFFVALAAGAVLVAIAPDGRATLAAAIYAGSLAALFGVSALYHRVNWRPASALDAPARPLGDLRLIAGTVTPFALLVLSGPFATALLVAVWAGAAAGIVVELFWVDAPKWVDGDRLPQRRLDRRARLSGDRRRRGHRCRGADRDRGRPLHRRGGRLRAPAPDPNPAVFGYHEIFHVLVIAAAVAHFTAVAIYALPAS